ISRERSSGFSVTVAMVSQGGGPAPPSSASPSFPNHLSSLPTKSYARVLADAPLFAPVSIAVHQPAFTDLGEPALWIIHLLIRCSSEDDYLRLLLREQLLVKGFLFKFLKWTIDFECGKEPPIAPVWVELPALKPNLFHETCISSVAGNIGRVLQVALRTSQLTNATAAYACVELDLLKDKPSRIWIGMGSTGFWQKIVYQHVPEYCTSCCLMGHVISNCNRTSSSKDDPLRKSSTPLEKDHPNRQRWTPKKKPLRESGSSANTDVPAATGEACNAVAPSAINPAMPSVAAAPASNPAAVLPAVCGNLAVDGATNPDLAGALPLRSPEISRGFPPAGGAAESPPRFTGGLPCFEGAMQLASQEPAMDDLPSPIPRFAAVEEGSLAGDVRLRAIAAPPRFAEVTLLLPPPLAPEESPVPRAASLKAKVDGEVDLAGVPAGITATSLPVTDGPLPVLVSDEAHGPSQGPSMVAHAIASTSEAVCNNNGLKVQEGVQLENMSSRLIDVADPVTVQVNTPLTFAQVVRQSTATQGNATIGVSSNSPSSGSSSGRRISRPSRKGGVRICLPSTRERSPSPLRPPDVINTPLQSPTLDMRADEGFGCC
ncbi:hypothetical protein Taro_031983, partial [Colocasia esculenta]|nr:hypothetical protein [Colocasia esculenta]